MCFIGRGENLLINHTQGQKHTIEGKRMRSVGKIRFLYSLQFGWVHEEKKNYGQRWFVKCHTLLCWLVILNKKCQEMEKGHEYPLLTIIVDIWKWGVRKSHPIQNLFNGMSHFCVYLWLFLRKKKKNFFIISTHSSASFSCTYHIPN